MTGRRRLPASLERVLPGQRLPGASEAHAPNMVVPAPFDGASAPTSEEHTDTTTWNTNQGEVSLYVTQGKWRSVDVFLSLVAGANALQLFIVRVYMRLPGGLRVLVQSGRTLLQTNGGAILAPVGGLVWAVAARTQPAHLEVTLEEVGLQGAALTGDVQYSIVASADLAPAPECVGEMVVTDTAGTGELSAIGRPELVSTFAVPNAGVASARWLHVHDRADFAALAGVIPLLSLPICGPAGAPALATNRIRLRSQKGIFRIVPSSTGDVSTIVADCTFRAVVR